MTAIEVPHSAGHNRPVRVLPSNACDSHMHIFDRRFTPSPHWTRQPPDAPVSAYRQLQKRLGSQRAVVVTPSTYGTDNACMLNALQELGDCACGVAVVGEDVSNAELSLLALRRVRGLRVNFVTPQSWGKTTQQMLSNLAKKVAEHPDCGNWHIQVFAHPEQLIQMASLLAALPLPVVIDHLGYIDPKEGVSGIAYDVLRRLLDRGNTWIKLSGAYMRSTAKEHTYSDTLPLGRALVEAAPERLVWGSDWPHTTATPGSVNDANLLDLLMAWTVSPSRMEQILVDNPAHLYSF
ncbi:amidohydrolase family protein [Comamonas testosteroni]|uniref:amidohydrolase family protein n=1 Tax=Comamonas testosteroni TaxID=285 RepID=UPI0005B4E3AB|nr:amidohydrolase family protein [Comamonas testosteroni]